MNHLDSSVEVESNPLRRSIETPELPPSAEEILWEECDIKEELDFTPSLHFSHPERCRMISDSEVNYLSGIPKNCFQSLFTMLSGESLTLPSCNMSAQDQLLLTLCKYKHNFPCPLLQIIFKIEQNNILEVFSFWTYHMFKTLKVCFGTPVKADRKVQDSVSVGFVEVPILKPNPQCTLHSGHCGTEEISSLKALVVIDDDNRSVLYCSKLYGTFTSNYSILLDMEFRQCVAGSRLIKLQGSLNVSNSFPGRDIQAILSDNVAPCLCTKVGESATCAFSSFLNTKRFQCFMEFFKILSEGLPPSLLVMSSEIFFNCMMVLNLPKAFGNTL